MKAKLRKSIFSTGILVVDHGHDIIIDFGTFFIAKFRKLSTLHKDQVLLVHR